MPDETIQMVVLDLGNVLLRFDMMRFAQRAAALSGQSVAAISQRYGSGPLKAAYERGETTETAFFQEMAAWLGCGERRIPELQNAWADVFEPLSGAVSGLEMIRAQYPLWIFSDTNPTHLRHFRTRFPWIFSADRFVPSYEFHCLKSEPGCFEALLEIISVPARTILFADDLDGNVQRAAAACLQTQIFTDWPQLLRRLAL